MSTRSKSAAQFSVRAGQPRAAGREGAVARCRRGDPRPRGRGRDRRKAGDPRGCGGGLRPAAARPAYVRVNAVDTEFCYGDLVAIVRAGLDGIILPKVESAAGLATVDWLLAQLERERGLPPGGIDLIPIIETARGSRPARRDHRAPARASGASRSAPAISRSTSTWSGAAARASWPLPARRSSLLRAPPGSRRRSIRYGSICPTRGSRSLGPHRARSRLSGQDVHPPGPDRDREPGLHPERRGDRLRRAGRRRFREAEAEGSAAIQLDGKFIDYPIVYRAQRVLTDRRDPPQEREGTMTPSRRLAPGRSTASTSSICAAISPGLMAAPCWPISAPT